MSCRNQLPIGRLPDGARLIFVCKWQAEHAHHADAISAYVGLICDIALNKNLLSS